MHNADWEEGERLSVSSTGAQVWATPPLLTGDPSSPSIGLLDSKEEVIYLEGVVTQQGSGDGASWHKVLTRLGVCYLRKWALSEPWESDNEDEE
jgi:hypothetical protein